MNRSTLKKIAFAAGLIAASVAPAQAQVRITEVASWASGQAPYAADWFELTNFGASAVSISGWTMDDDSANPNSALLTGVTTINPNESVIFLELATGGNATTLKNSFLSTWFGASVPSGLQVGTYTQGVAGGVGLGTGGDQVNIYNGVAGTLQAKVTLGVANNAAAPFQTFDNSAGANNVTLSALSVVGVNGAFQAVNGVVEIGSPGVIAAAVPEPETYALMLAGLGLLGFAARRRKQKESVAA